VTEPVDQRITVSLSTLQAELGKLELRLVDRLNGALESKGEKVVQEQHTRELQDLSTRLLSLEGTALTRDGALAQQVTINTRELDGLRSVTGYKRWLWAQTLALAAIALGVIGERFL
jgi:hypothetical protein